MLLQRHHVGHHLAGMGEVGEAVDDRNGGRRGEFREVGVARGADHDGIDIARENARRVGDGLAAAQLHVA